MSEPAFKRQRTEPPPPDTAFENFKKWLIENGARLDKLDIRKDANGVAGVYATDHLDVGEVYATIPFKLVISETLVREALPQFSHLSSRAAMSTFIVHEVSKGEASFFHPYFQIIPRVIMTAMRFDEEDIRLLMGTNLESGVRERKEKLWEEFEYIVEHMPDELNASTLTWDAFLWAYTAISSRAFPHKLLDPTSEAVTDAMFPLADSMNHHPLTKVTWRSRGDILTEDGALELITEEEVEAGEQLYNNYGPKSNEELLLGYGFCFKDNPFDYVHLKVNFSRDPRAAVKQRILDRAGIPDPKQFIQRQHVPPALLAQLRVLVMKQTETERYAEETVSEGEFEFVGYRNELAMLLMLEGMLKGKLEVLRRFGEELPEEEEGWTEWQRFAIWYREGQVTILNDAISIAQTMLAQTAAQMHADLLAGRIARPPFLRIDNPDTLRSPYANGVAAPGPMATPPWITVNGALQEDERFLDAVGQLFEDVDEEQDTILILFLVRESENEGSKWKKFFESVKAYRRGTNANEEDAELRDLYDSLFPTLSDSFPDVFNAQLFTFERFAWAAGLLYAFSITVQRGGFEGDEAGEMVCVVPM